MDHTQQVSPAPDALAQRFMRLVINGKAAEDLWLRKAIEHLRSVGHRIDVRVTWEAGDALRYACEAIQDGVDLIGVVGGDGTMNEVINGVLSHCGDDTSSSPQEADEQRHDEPAIGIIPSGTANDFATGAAVPLDDPLAALRLCFNREPVAVDVGRVNDRYFLNVATGGIGALATTSTSPALKRTLGGVAYSLHALVMAMKQSSWKTQLVVDDETMQREAMVIAVGNGRQAGGGYALTPRAYIDDGKLDLMIIHDVTMARIGTLVAELADVEAAEEFIDYRQARSIHLTTDEPMQLNLDGEPLTATDFRIQVLPKRLRLILPESSPLMSTTAELEPLNG